MGHIWGPYAIVVRGRINFIWGYSTCAGGQVHLDPYVAHLRLMWYKYGLNYVGHIWYTTGPAQLAPIWCPLGTLTTSPIFNPPDAHVVNIWACSHRTHMGPTWCP